MVEAGLVEEVKHLCDKYGELPLLNTLGYAEIKQYLAGDLNLRRSDRAGSNSYETVC